MNDQEFIDKALEFTQAYINKLNIPDKYIKEVLRSICTYLVMQEEVDSKDTLLLEGMGLLSKQESVNDEEMENYSNEYDEYFHSFKSFEHKGIKYEAGFMITFESFTTSVTKQEKEIKMVDISMQKTVNGEIWQSSIRTQFVNDEYKQGTTSEGDDKGLKVISGWVIGKQINKKAEQLAELALQQRGVVL